MTKPKKNTNSPLNQIPKCVTGIQGLDEITEGGLPRTRSTLVTGYTGCGKTLLGLQFLVNGVKENEPGLFVSFEESEQELIANCSSLEFHLKTMVDNHQIVLLHIPFDLNQFDEAGEYNLDGLFVRIGAIIDQYKIKRVVLDTIELLFSHLANDVTVRSELQRLFSWLKMKKVTSIVTAEETKNRNTITRYGLEEYVSDCVIALDNFLYKGLATRHMHIIKYRGSAHGSNKYPFIIDQRGISVIPITSIQMNMDFQVPRTFVSSGVKPLDEMLNGNGYYKGSSVLITGTPGVGKTSFAAVFADSICKKGKKCIFFSFEESSDQIIRNTNTLGIHLEKWVKNNKLLFFVIKPTVYEMESYLLKMLNLIEQFKPNAVVIDPITNLKLIGSSINEKLMLRMISYLKSKQITTVMTSLIREGTRREEKNIYSLVDTWIVLKHVEYESERSIVLNIYKSRGMPHSKRLREVIMSDKGLELVDVIVSAGKVLTGSARVLQAMQDNIKNIQQDYHYREKLLKTGVGKTLKESDK